MVDLIPRTNISDNFNTVGYCLISIFESAAHTHNFSTQNRNQFQQTKLQNRLSMFPICCGKEALIMVMGIQKAMATGKKWRMTILTAGLGTIGMARPSKSTREVHTCRDRMRRTL